VLQQERVKNNIEAYRGSAVKRLNENVQTYLNLLPELSKIDKDYLKLTFEDESKVMDLNELLAAITEQLHQPP
jgi:hypothetical protein